MRNCCIPFCKASDRTGDVTYHEIPANLVLREKWLKAISRKDWVPSDHAVVCSRHFLPEEILQDTKRKRVKPGCVPSIFQGYPSYMQPKKVVQRSSSAIQKRELSLAAANLVGVDGNTSKKKSNEPEHNVAEVPVIYASPVEPEKCDAAVQVSVYKIARTKDVKKWTADARRLKRRIKKLENELVAYKTAEENEHKLTPVFRKVAKAADDSKNQYALFIMDQIQNFGHPKARWSEPTIRECIKWRHISSKGYEQARRLVHLPSRSTLCRFSSVSVNGIEDVKIGGNAHHQTSVYEEPVALDLLDCNSEENDWSGLAMCVEVASDKTINGIA